MCTSSLHGVMIAMIGLLFHRLIPPALLEGGESPLVPLMKGEMFPPLGGCPQGGGFIPQKNEYFFVLL